ncbi:triphosphoribosyl-dephospho-CoA synthase, partial [Cellulosimicrobium funkei]
DRLHAPLTADSPGQRARARHRVPGVREQAAGGFPLLRELAVPALRDALGAGLRREAAPERRLDVADPFTDAAPAPAPTTPTTPASRQRAGV